MIVIKRDGSKQLADRDRIVTAATLALKDAGFRDDKFVEDLADRVMNKLEEPEVHIEKVQEHVENDLMRSRYKDAARSYIEFRTQRDVARDSRSKLNKEIQGLVKQTNTLLLNENANKDGKIIPTQRDLLAGIVSKHYALQDYLPKAVARAHEKGELHYHDLDYAPFFPMFNCFSSNTKFVTVEGLKTFEDYADGDIIHVPSHTGAIRKARVRNYGEQQLNTVVLKRGRSRRTVHVTANHRWLTTEGETTSLSVGDALVHAPDLTQGDVDPLSWCLGFGYGDGTQEGEYFRLRLCGNKTQYASHFADAGFNVTYPLCYNGDASVVLVGYKKELPTKDIDVRSFCLGYAAADASEKNIQATSNESIDFIRENFDVAGMYIGAEQDFTDQVTNYGKRTDTTVMFNITKPTHYRWVVESISEYAVEQVWCLEVEEDHSFILQGGIVTGNCMLIDLRNMLENGFSLGNASIDTPKSITTATAVTAQIIAQVASHIYGGNTINGIDTILEKYVTMTYNKHLKNVQSFAQKLGILDEAANEKEAMRLTEKTTYDAFQALEYEVNTLHCANGQTPFCTFGFGLGTSWEAKLIQKSLLEVRQAGIGKDGNTAVFPKLVFAIKDGVNHKETDPNYDIKQMAIECASKRMYPDILNYERLVETTGGFKFPMGCRSYLNEYTNPETGEAEHDGRNNLGVVSINLPRIAIKSKNEKDFFKKLDKMITLSGEALMTRIERLEHVQAKVAPILYTEGACGIRLKPDDYVIDIFKNGRASISLGYIGIHETVNALVNEHIFDSTEAKELSIRIITRLREACDKWKEETGFAFGLYSTPSENLCDRFCRLDTKEFGIIPGVTDKGYYTNSFHLDVEHKVTPFEKIDFEKPYAAIANGGFISYAEFPTMRNNLKGLEAVWDYAFEHVPYFGTNTPVDQCHSCSYEGEFSATAKGFECPQCGNRDEETISVVRRVCGYLGEANARPFVEGKQNEVLKRVKHC